MENYFGYGDFENSLVYMIGGVEALIIYFVVAFASRYVRDSTLQGLPEYKPTFFNFHSAVQLNI